MVRQLVVSLVAGDEVCDGGVNGCSDMTDDVVMRRLVMDVVHDGGKVIGKMRDMFVGGEVCSVGVSVGSLLSPRLLSPRLLSPGS